MSYTFELNNEKRDSNFVNAPLREKSPVVEIFNTMVQGKELKGFGKEHINKTTKHIAELNNRALNNDPVAIAELNTIRRLAIQPIVLQEIKLLSVFGHYTPLGFEESCEVEITEYANVNAAMQAAGQDVTFPVIRKKRVPVPTVTISGGSAVDYRRAALGDMTKENELQEEVRKQIRNNASKYVINTTYNAIKNATGIKYLVEDAGLTKTNTDKGITQIRRHGKPTVAGDYALISQFNNFAGYVGTTPTISGISEAVMKEIHDTGLMGIYNGALLHEIANPYDLSRTNAAGDNFETVLPQGLGFIIPAGGQSPVYSVSRGGLTSFTGNDVTSGTHMSRFDLEIGTIIVPGQEYKLGLIHDTNLDNLAD